jgi:hypothetical protein
MLSEVGGSRKVWPVGDVTITARIEPSVPVTTWLTVPMLVPPEFWTVSPVVSPGNVLDATLPRARTLFGLACAIPVGDACAGPWLLTALVVLVVLVVVAPTALFGLAWDMLLIELLSDP